MKIISKDKFKQLAKVNKINCISIFIPTHRTGEEVNQMIDQKTLKNRLKTLEKDPALKQLTDNEKEKLFKPVNDLIEDYEFWQHQSDGLAIFLNQDEFHYYTLPVYFEEFSYVSDHFYLKPLVPYINDSAKFYLLALSLKGAKFFEGFAHQIDEIEMDDLFPSSFEDSVGHDYEEKNLQFHTGKAGNDTAMYHGHGKGKEDEKTEIEKFFRDINNGLMKFLHDKDAPLVLATVDYLVPLYKEVNEYKYLADEFIPGNPVHEDATLLHEKARDILAEHFDGKRNEKIAAFEQALADAKASFKEEEIVPAAINQRVDTLFVRNREDLWGIFDKDQNKALIRDEKSEQNVCLLNLATVHTILNGGDVFLLDADDLPEPASKLNAIFRY
jgi:hypothetical protein